MKVQGKGDITGIAPTPPEGDPGRAAAVPSQVVDRVTVEARPRADVVATARQRAAADRALRLEQLESAIRSGHYRPDAARLAEQLLTAAEIDAQLRALLSRS